MFARLIGTYNSDVFSLYLKESKKNKFAKKKLQKTNFNPKNHIFFNLNSNKVFYLCPRL